jgi:hypothetical protein
MPSYSWDLDPQSNYIQPPPKPTSNTGYYDPRLGGSSMQVQGGRTPSQMSGIDRNGAAAAFAPRDPMQNPGNNLTNPGYDEQAFLYTQNRYLNDPSAGLLQDQYNNLQNPSQPEQFMNDNLGSLMGPGQGDQYWNQMQGQYMDPMAGEQFARQATQNFGAQGPASAFYDQAMGQYDQFTGYQGPQNTQGQYQQSAGQLANGTQGEQGLGQLAGQYGAIGQYQGGNQAMGQYQQNAASGPMAAQSFYDQVGGSYGQMGQYSDPNLAAGQYAQTQQAFGDMPIANFDPFYDRARQLATQDYNRQSAGRGVYGSSEALSGVGNVITDIEAQRANRSFDAEMQRTQEQRARQELLGNQARMGDLSSLAAFGANLSGLETFGNLANNAGNQTLNQQTMLGNQARNADLTALDAFNGNINAATAFGNINNQLASQELNRNELLGNMANNADSQALGAQNANIAGMQAYGNIANNADTAETNRYEASTNAMLNADKFGLDRMNSGADIAFKSDENKRANYDSSMQTANNAATLGMDRTKTSAEIATTLSNNDLNRLNSFNTAAGGAENSRQGRLNSRITAEQNRTNSLQNTLSGAYNAFLSGDQAAWENSFDASLAPYLQEAGYSQQEIDALRKDAGAAMSVIGMAGGTGGGGSTTQTAAKPARKLDPNPY